MKCSQASHHVDFFSRSRQLRKTGRRGGLRDAMCQKGKDGRLFFPKNWTFADYSVLLMKTCVRVVFLLGVSLC